jgi:hypothetical protein
MLSDAILAELRAALEAGRKLDAVKQYREATGAGLAEAKAFVDQLEAGAVIMNDMATARGKSATLLADYGWLVEPTEGGVRLRRSALWRGAMMGCSFAIGLLLSPILIGLWLLRDRLWDGPPEGGVRQIATLLIPLAFVGVAGLFYGALIWRMLGLALWREEWIAKRNRLLARRGLVGFLRGRDIEGGEFLLEPHFDGDPRGKRWRLAVIADGEKHYLIREPGIQFGFDSLRDSHAEASAIADLLAVHTGWVVSQTAIAIEGDWKPPAESNEEELLTALRSHRFVVELDDRARLTICRPKFGQWIGGLALLAIGVGWLWMAAGVAASFVHDARAKEQPVFDLPFWLLMIPFLMFGVALCVLGIVAVFSRERWTVDRNLLLVRGRIFGWKSEHEYVNARWKLARVRRSSKSGSYHVWQLQLENASGRTVKVLHQSSDDDVPRLLGTLFSRRSGWSLIDANP